MDYCIFCLGTIQAATASTTWSDIAQVITAIVSLAVAGIALRLTRKQANEMILLGEATRKHNRISVRPLIDLHIIAKSDHASITVKNCGIGPAIIESVQLNYQEHNLKLDTNNLIKLIVEKFTNFPYLEPVEIIGEYVLSQNQELRIITITPGPDSNNFTSTNLESAFKNAIEFVRTLEISVNYRCIYGDKYYFEHNTKGQ